MAGRLASARNRQLTAHHAGRIVGGVAIDGEDLGGGVAHLRWFIVDEAERGRGLGRELLVRAVAFCSEAGFAAIELWTFAGLDAARHLYQDCGFVLVEEKPGSQWGRTVNEQRFVRTIPTAYCQPKRRV